jgi:hypothetical protein
MSLDMMGRPVGGRYDVHSRWSVKASKEIELSPSHLEGFVGDAVTEALDMAVDHAEPTVWSATLRRPYSMFDECLVKVTIAGAPEDSRSVVEAEVTFDTSSSRLGVSMGAVTSLIGAPFVWGWRYQSIRSAKTQARKIIDALWRALDARTATTAYR